MRTKENGETRSLVLVIEDDAPVARLMVRALEAAGYRANAAPNAIEAIRLVRREHPDLILADLRLPGLDGAFTTLSIRDEPGMESVPIVLVSGDPDLAARAAEAGAADLVAKPFMPGDLVRRVRRILEAA